MLRGLAHHTLGLLTLSLAIACSSDLQGPDDDDDTPPITEDKITTTENDDGSFTSIVNASDADAWVYLDLESRMEVEVTNPKTSNDWDVAFRRFRTITNGGFNGNGGVEVAVLEGATFDGISGAPSSGYWVDEDDDPEEDGVIPDDAIRVGPTSETGPWGYNVETHELSASGAVFVVKSVEGNFFALEYLEYYDENGNPGHVELHWKRLGEQLGPNEMLVSWDVDPAYVSFENGQVTVDDPETSLDWDFAIRIVGWRTNSGEGRAGAAGALLADATTLDAIEDAPTVGYAQDREILYPGPPGSPMFLGNPVLTDWFDYDPVNHLATPKDIAFIVRGARGDYAKLKILSYDEPNKTYKIALVPIDRRVDTLTTTVDATAPGTWVYMSMREGKEVEVTDASMEAAWDIAFSETKIRTNSGTSGPGEGGAQRAAQAALDAVASAPSDGYTIDEMLVDPVDGVTMYSGNAVLGDWWTVDTSSATVPLDQSFVVRAADGSFAKMKITGYANGGEYTIDWAYAGPGETDF